MSFEDIDISGFCPQCGGAVREHEVRWCVRCGGPYHPKCGGKGFELVCGYCADEEAK
jgi:hypothetical protein